MLLRFLNIQGIAGIAVGVALAILLVVQKVETRHWRKESGQYEQLYTKEQAALAGTVANYRTAADAARAADQANAQRAAAAQTKISQETSDEFETRLAAARAAAERLRVEASAAAADPGRRGAAPVPALPAAAGGPAQTTGQDGLSVADRLSATEQAIQLDELIKWVKAQVAVDVNGATDRPTSATEPGASAAVDSARH
jgi:signal transduction histidine kinase